MARFIGKPTPTIGLARRGMASGSVKANVKVLGLDVLIAKLAQINIIARAELGLLTAGAAKHMEQAAKNNIHSVTGNLVSGVYSVRVAPYTWTVIASSMAGDDPAGVGKNSYEYAAWVEFGTSKMPGRFYMARAYNETRPLVISGLKQTAMRIQAL